jgi:hypothetical protein
MVQADTCRPFTAEACVRSQIIPCEICGGQSDPKTGLFFPVIIIPPVLHTHLHVQYMLLLTERHKKRTFESSKKLCCSVNRGALYRKVLSFFQA